jgi:hypothetical protein
VKGEKDMKTKTVVTGIMVVVFLIFFSIPCFSQTIYGCYHHKNGKLRIVADHSLCKKTELPITFNTGEQGLPGPQGPQGPQGEQGPPGVVQGPIVLMEMGGGVATQTTDMDGNTLVTLFEYPCSATSPDYMHTSLTLSVLSPVSPGSTVKLVVSYNDNDQASYDNSVKGIDVQSGTGVYGPMTFEFNAAKRQITDTTCAFWKIVSVSYGSPFTVRYSYTVTYPQK